MAAAAAVALAACTGGGPPVDRSAATGGAVTTTTAPPPPRTLEPYRGLGAWVDVFDYAPAYQPEGQRPPVVPEDVAVMAAFGVRTLFLQAARDDPRSPGGVVDHELIGAFLAEAEEHGVAVVGWYLPRFERPEVDLAHLLAMHGTPFGGRYLDGVAVDIEFTEARPDHGDRNAVLVELSRRLRAAVGDDVVGAIVLPPVLTEVINPALWPDFPWGELGDLYDVWLPMSYWTFRSAESGYGNGYDYNTESVRRLRANLGDPAVPVHSIGGIGDRIPEDGYGDFVRSLIDTGSIGGSIYDFRTMSVGGWARLREAFTTGPAARLPASTTPPTTGAADP